MSDPIIKDGKAPSTSCPHGDDKTIIKGHVGKEIKDDKEEEQTQVQEIQDLRCRKAYWVNAGEKIAVNTRQEVQMIYVVWILKG